MTSTFDQKEKLQHIFQKYISLSENNTDISVDIEFFSRIVHVFRPKIIQRTKEIPLTPLMLLLNENEHYKEVLAQTFQRLIQQKEFDQIISDAAIIKDTDFLYEVRKRTIEKLLPQQPPKNSLQFVLNQVFYSSSDPIWLKNVPTDHLEDLMDILQIPSLYQETKENFAMSELLYGIEVLILRITGKAMETDVNKMVPEFQNFDSPFIALQREFGELHQRLLSSDTHYISSNDLTYKQILLFHNQCENYIDTAFENSKKFGISMKVNQSLLRIRLQLERIKELLPFIVLNRDEDRKHQTVQLGLRLIHYNCDKNNIQKLINESTQVLSYEITQHTAHTGEKYITESRKEYFKMLRTAGGGGIIVAFLCIFKVLLSKLDTSIFGHAFFYSMNYSFGFIAIYILGCTLATKQPSMTATTLVSALEHGAKNISGNVLDKYRSFAILFARVFRSQFIAFVGNVFLAFPVALFLIWSIDFIFDYNIAHKKWHTLLNDLSPVTSPAIFHAAIAGIFLFISGIIAGSIANRDKHNSVYYRIQEHPILKKTFGKKKTEKFAKWYEKKWAGIISNFWFGVFMGSTASIGIFLGLNLDIRHITFASGNLALGLYGNDFQVPLQMIIWGIIGIGVIGFVNFIVSFSLSLFLAFRSRDIALAEIRLVTISVWRYFKEKPLHFFFPPKQVQPITVEETIEEDPIEPEAL